MTGEALIATQDGDVFVHTADERLAPISRNPMGDAIFATPAVAQDTLIVRTVNAVFGIATKS
jgi:hypothetical protein